ncbi:hypothetical protein NUU61_004182 [Penicillium alfredii]|uniref:Ribosome biogenesis protein Alb1 n=1 Tax=Penicillium alfredii TaxID=1506179 RepID=A0A9W9FL06_9EURO|nr:uncharacterized protein NUU61_004182 [Penicillium alfredii]KAJ5101960.1 hypothetical protein NUU61_004182 [Penicillium alfredii]
MAKNRPASQNSRAARRAVSPGLNVDKSLTSLPRASSPTVQRPSILAERSNAGIQKKQSKGKRISRAQRLRQEKGMERAEAVSDQLQIKKAKSVARAKNVKARRADWEDTNQKSSMFAALQQDQESEGEASDDAMAEDTVPSTSTANAAVSQPTPVVANPVAEDPATVDEDDEIT